MLSIKNPACATAPCIFVGRLERGLSDTSNRHGGLVVPNNLDLRDRCRQTSRDHRAEQALEMAPLSPAEDRLQLPPLIVVRALVDVQSESTVPAEKIARPLGSERDSRAIQLDAVRFALPDVEREDAGTPTEIGCSLWPKPTRTQHLATAQFDTSA
jgi:hypothetical protein